MESSYNVSVVIPAYNESANFHRGVLDEVYDFLRKQKYKWEVILVNDGSTDDTLTLLNSFAKHHKGFWVADIKHGGKVKAVMAGVERARGKVTIFTDFDQSVSITNLDPMLDQFNAGCDIVISTRYKIEGWTKLQKFRSSGFNLLVQLLALPGVKDSQCGFKGFRGKVGKELFKSLEVTARSQKSGYMGAFDVELLYLARKYGYKIGAIDVDWLYHESKRLSFSEPLKMIRDVLLVRWTDLSGSYEKSL